MCCWQKCQKIQDLTPVSAGLHGHSKRVTGPPGCQMVTDHWFYSQDKAVLWRLEESKYLICPESDSLLALRMGRQIVPSTPGLKFHSFVLLWPANYML